MFISLYQLIFKQKWYFSIILPELIKSLKVHYTDKTNLPENIFFSNSSSVYKPLWTYAVENKNNANSYLFFYSTHCENRKINNKYPPISWGYKLMSWNNYIVWDDYQKNWLFRINENLNSNNIIVSGPILLNNGYLDPKIKTNNKILNISIFDIVPKKSFLNKEFFNRETNMDIDISNKFLRDMDDVLKESNICIYHKVKKNINNNDDVSTRYKNNLYKLNQYQNYNILDSNSDIYKVINKSDLVISFPFTSASIISKSMKKYSIYYDPLMVYYKNDRAFHGLEVVSGIGQLLFLINKLKLSQ